MNPKIPLKSRKERISMKTAVIICGALLTFFGLFSASGKFSKIENTMKAMEHVGVKPAQIKILAILETLGALGIIVGIWSKPLGIVAASGMTLYFIGAVVAHLRIKDKLKDYAPALFIFIVAALTLVFELKRK
jgi:uncharacterized membrane protein YphA (DoxX/SURF4 family)